LPEDPEVNDRRGLSDPFLSSGAVPWEKEKQIPPRAGEDGQQVGAADHARRRLAQACQQLDGSRALVIALPKGRRPPIVQCLVGAAIEGYRQCRIGKPALGSRPDRPQPHASRKCGDQLVDKI
jgi:hypothetical protein